MNEIVLTACSSFVVIEMISFLSGNERTVKVVCSLALTLMVLTSLVSAGREINLKIDTESFVESDTEQLYLSETQEILKEQVKEAMSAAGIYDIKPEIILTMDENSDVSVRTLKVGVRHPSDLERARIILREMFGESMEGEVHLID